MATITISELIKSDKRTAFEIADLANLHSNTVYKFRGGYEPIDPRARESLEALARLYGYRVRVIVELIPENGN